jgi:hypothetical protein
LKQWNIVCCLPPLVISMPLMVGLGWATRVSKKILPGVRKNFVSWEGALARSRPPWLRPWLKSKNNWSSSSQWEGVKWLCWLYYFSSLRFFSLGFPLQGFSEAVLKHTTAHKNNVLFFLRHMFFSYRVFLYKVLTRQILWSSKGECYECIHAFGR